MHDTWVRGGYRFTIARGATALAGKAGFGGRGGKFDPDEHPRDRRGRFIEVGAEVDILGGGHGTVVGVGGGGRIQVQLADGKTVERHRNYLTITKTASGAKPPAGTNPDDDAKPAAPKPGAPKPAAPAAPAGDKPFADLAAWRAHAAKPQTSKMTVLSRTPDAKLTLSPGGRLLIHQSGRGQFDVLDARTGDRVGNDAAHTVDSKAKAEQLAAAIEALRDADGNPPGYGEAGLDPWAWKDAEGYNLNEAVVLARAKVDRDNGDTSSYNIGVETTIRRRRDALNRMAAPKPGAGPKDPEVEAIHAALNDMVSTADARESLPHTQFDTWEKMLAQGTKDKAAYDALLTGVGEELGADAPDFGEALRRAKSGEVGGGMILLAPLKGEKRATEKVMGKYDGEWWQLTDVVRGTIVVPTLAEVPTAIEALRTRAAAAGWEIRDFQNRYNTPPPQWATGATDAGYRDAKLTLVSPDGLNTELQINTAPMFIAKEGDGHKFYEDIRPILERVDAGGAPMTDEERAMVSDRTARSEALYSDAARKSYPPGVNPEAVAARVDADMARSQVLIAARKAAAAARKAAAEKARAKAKPQPTKPPAGTA